MAGMFPAADEAWLTSLRKGNAMKRFLALALVATLGVFTIGCETKKGTSENKTQTTVTQTKDGKVTGETTTTTSDKTKITPSATPGAADSTTERTTETTTETTK
jgi:hypothetical protein